MAMISVLRSLIGLLLPLLLASLLTPDLAWSAGSAAAGSVASDPGSVGQHRQHRPRKKKHHRSRTHVVPAAKPAKRAAAVDATPPAVVAAADPAGAGTDLPAVDVVIEGGAAERQRFEVALGPALTGWSYDLQSSALSSHVLWSPLDPIYGAALGASYWPLPAVGVEASGALGVTSFGASSATPLPRADLTSYALSARLLLRHDFACGLAVDGRVGYRLTGSAPSSRLAPLIFPAHSAHLLGVGGDVVLTALRPWVELRLGGELVPIGLLSQQLAPANGVARLWGWRVEGGARSELTWGLFADLQLFYETSYSAFTSSALVPGGESAFGDVNITNGNRGALLGLGWRF